MTDIYREMINQYVVPQPTLSAEEQQIYKATYARLYTPNDTVRPNYDNYLTITKNMRNTLTKIEIWKSQNPTNEIVPSNLQNELEDERTEYRRIRGDAIRKDVLALENFDRRSGEFYFENLRKRFDVNYSTAYSFGRVNLYPSYPNWLDAKQEWQRVTTDSSKLEQTTHNSSSSIGGGLSASWGLFSIGGDFGSTKDQRYTQTEVSNMNLAFDVLRVAIDFPWMDSSLFRSHAWDLGPANAYYPNGKISTGADPSKGQTPGGLMPMIPTGLLIGRNVALSADWKFNIDSYLKTQSGGGGGIGFGPFRLGGRASSTDEQSYKLAEANGNKITMGLPQIIGFFAEVLPLSPARDPSLKWPDSRPLEPLSLTAEEADPLLARVNQVLRQAGK